MANRPNEPTEPQPDTQPSEQPDTEPYPGDAGQLDGDGQVQQDDDTDDGDADPREVTPQ